MPESDMRPCPVPDCTRRRSSQYLMCRPDWWRVSALTRNRVYATVDDPFSLECSAAAADAIAEAVASR